VRLLQPCLGDRLQAAENFVERTGLHHRRGNFQADIAGLGLDRNDLQVGVLASILLRSAELPLTGVAVPNVLCVISRFSAYLTNLSH